MTAGTERAASTGATVIGNCTPGLERSWFPVALSAEVTTEPISVLLLGEAWMVVRMGDGLFAARDRCPHRLAPLSIGSVVGDTFQCRYHGWRFDTEGACVRIPSAPEDLAVPPRARASTPFGVAEHLGMVWIAPEEPMLGLPEVPEWDLAGFDRIEHEPRRTTASAAQLMDNFVDVSHFATVHATTFGVPDNTVLEPVDVTVDDWTATTDYTTWYLNHDDPLVTTGEHELAQPHDIVKTARPPFTVYMRLGFPLTDQVISILYAMQPETETSTRIFKIMARNDFGGDEDKIAEMLDFEDRVLDEDLAVLESFRSNQLHLDPKIEVHTRADRLSLAYRRLLDRLVNGGPAEIGERR
ncbi:MAG: aromatic ring-hydroxylating dioxygenase subunit alpha [Actinomycetota bacterium]